MIVKNYDCNKDGCLSLDEFEAVSLNFPFIDSFDAIDSDRYVVSFTSCNRVDLDKSSVLLISLGRDGVISKSDLKSYFISTNSKAIRVAFQHDFNETTYFKPTFCAHCAGLVS